MSPKTFERSLGAAYSNVSMRRRMRRKMLKQDVPKDLWKVFGGRLFQYMRSQKVSNSVVGCYPLRLNL